MPLSDIVNVQITRQTSAVSRAGFGTALILGTNRRIAELIKYYSSLESVAADFNSTDAEYIAAAAIFSQSPTVTQIAIGRRDVQDKTVVTVTQADSTEYKVTINGTEFTYTSASSGDTAADIAAALVLAINGGTEPVTATDNLDGTFDLDPDVAGTAYALNLTPVSLLTADALVPAQAYADDLDDIVDVSNDWYALVLTSKLKADQLLVAAWIETKRKIFFYRSDDSDIIDTTDAADSPTTGTIAAQLKGAAYARTGGLYHGSAATQNADAAWFGKILPQDPGSYTAMFKTLAGITVDGLTDTQAKNALDKYANTYEEIGGKNIAREGKVAEGEYIDTIIFVDWLQARITEDVYAAMVNLPKVPYTDQGVAIIEAALRARLEDGVEKGGLVAGSIVITVPKVADVLPADKAARLLPDVKFTAQLQGAIHAVNINGVVTL